MSTLDLPRIHFRGRFFTDPSTQNNRKEWFPPGADYTDDPHKQNWNPTGQHAFELRGCRVGAASTLAGTVLRAESDDPVLGGDVTTPSDLGLGRMVDLDPDFQSAPQLWGVRVRIAGKDGRGVTGVLETATLYPRPKQRSQGAGDLGVAGTYTSFLSELSWDSGLTGVLAELKTTHDTRLAITFTLYRFGRILRPGTPYGLYEGSVVGTVGPASEERTPPRVLDPFVYDAKPWGIPPGMADSFPFKWRHGPAPAQVDLGRQVLVLDLSNGLLEEVRDGLLERRNYGTLTVRAERLKKVGEVDERVDLSGSIPIAMDDYEALAGVHEFGLPPEISDPAEWRFVVESSEVGRILAERPDGLRIEVSNPVVRLDPPRAGEDPATQEQTVELRARAFGAPAAEVPLAVYIIGNPDPLPAGLSWRVSGDATNAAGVLQITFVPSDPGAPRGEWVDGLLVKIGFGRTTSPSDRQGSIGVRVFDPYPREGTWANVEPILSLYARVYPRMGFLASAPAIKALLSSYPHLLLRRGEDELMPMTDPRYMPVTRDLSRDKRDALFAWLDAGAPIPEAED